jgi:hypothetical protein
LTEGSRRHALARLAHPPEARPPRAGGRRRARLGSHHGHDGRALVMLVWGVASEALRDIITGFLNQVRFD